MLHLMCQSKTNFSSRDGFLNYSENPLFLILCHRMEYKQAQIGQYSAPQLRFRYFRTLAFHGSSTRVSYWQLYMKNYIEGDSSILADFERSSEEGGARRHAELEFKGECSGTHCTILGRLESNLCHR